MAINEQAVKKIASRNVLVMGTGITGLAVVDVLLELGVKCSVFEANKNDATMDKAKTLDGRGVKVIFPHDSDFDKLTEPFDLIVPSPGISSKDPYLSRLIELKREVISEIELGFILMKPATIIAITGTNGKTTTTELIHAILICGGKNAMLAGNIGIPFIKTVMDSAEDAIICLEVSSFQLSFVATFRPKVSLITNITEDHLDWHYDFADYVRAKSKIFINQDDEDIAVLNMDCLTTSTLKPTARVVRTTKVAGTQKEADRVELLRTTSGERIVYADWRGGRRAFDISYSKLIGEHNAENILSAIAATLVFDLKDEDVTRAIREFSPSGHRLEPAGVSGDVRFFNDSKATNPDAAIRAMEAMEENYVMIAGGRNKGNDFKPLRSYVQSDPQARMLFKGMVLIGESTNDLKETLDGVVETSIASSIEDAVRKAIILLRKESHSGGSVLFSPACASFDMFKDYKDRGDKFKQAVNEIIQG